MTTVKRCRRTPAYRSAGACEAAISTRSVDLPAGTRGQSEQCACGKWHVAAVPLTAAGMDAPRDVLNRMCLIKTRYATEGAAIISALRRPGPLRAYACPLCAGWHLTKKAHYDDPA